MYYSNPVFRGDHPDPSVVRVGDDYYATTTSTEWAPQFPLLHSRDLVHWRETGAVFSDSPKWSNGKYWAPEISYDGRRFFVYYVAQHKGGPLTIGVATAAAAAGPYEDHGPLVGQSAGSIDPTPVYGDDGERYLMWKEDGNSVGLPTTLWIQPLSEDGLRLTGQARAILTNDAAWEGHVIEAPSVIKRDGLYYLFYSGNACCGRNCKYAVGVARATSPLGPWQKFSGNPILKGNAQWRCPGHGSVVDTKDGRTYFLYHAYAKRESIFIGRQVLLDEVTWENGWPKIARGTPTSHAALPFRKPQAFRRMAVRKGMPAGPWQWPHDRKPSVAFGGVLAGGAIMLQTAQANDDALATVIARAPHYADYEVETALDVRSLPEGAQAGICAYGDAKNATGLSYIDGKLRVWQRTAGVHRILATHDAPDVASLRVRMRATRGYLFEYDVFDGRRWQALRRAPIRAAYLPPWDRGVRVALSLGGPREAQARFKFFRMRQCNPKDIAMHALSS